MGSHADRTVVVEVGKLRPFSDNLGRHVVRLDDSSEKRQELVSRLETAGCPVNIRHKTDWHRAGSFQVSESAPVPPPLISDQTEVSVPFKFASGEVVGTGANEEVRWDFQCQIYIEPLPGVEFVMPFHRCSACCRFPEGEEVSFDSIELFGRSPLLIRSGTEMLIGGPGLLVVQGQTSSPQFERGYGREIEIRISLGISGQGIFTASSKLYLNPKAQEFAKLEGPQTWLNEWKADA